MSCLVSFALPFFPFSFVLFFVGVVPLPTANGRDGALMPKTGNRILRLFQYCFAKKFWNKNWEYFFASNKQTNF